MHEAIGRIYTMEAVFDALLNSYLKLLTAYYESPLWRYDYELDEKGLLPAGLKRGILAEDSIYNFLAERSEHNG